MIKVLYIDDEPINLNLFYISFRRDFNIFKTLFPKEGLSILEEEDIDVLVTDQKMPLMSGYEVIKEIKKKKPELNCILLTAYYDPVLLDDPEFQALVFKYLEKPFRKDQMRELIREARKG